MVEFADLDPREVVRVQIAYWYSPFDLGVAVLRALRLAKPEMNYLEKVLEHSFCIIQE